MYIFLRGKLMRRLHLLIDDDLYEKLKRAAFLRGESVGETVRKTIRDGVERVPAEADSAALTRAEIHDLLRVLDARELALIGSAKK